MAADRLCFVWVAHPLHLKKGSQRPNTGMEPKKEARRSAYHSPYGSASGADAKDRSKHPGIFRQALAKKKRHQGQKDEVKEAR